MTAAPARDSRRAREHAATRASILEAARRVAARGGARELSLRGVAAEAGFSPAALYGYFRDKDELLLALAADDLSAVARACATAAAADNAHGLLAAAGAALAFLKETETFAAASAALGAAPAASDAERLFNGRLIAALTALSDATGIARPQPRGAGRRGADGRRRRRAGPAGALGPPLCARLQRRRGARPSRPALRPRRIIPPNRGNQPP